MKFAWTEKDKERFFKRAERQLKAAGIDFVQVEPGTDRCKRVECREADRRRSLCMADIIPV